MGSPVHRTEGRGFPTVLRRWVDLSKVWRNERINDGRQQLNEEIGFFLNTDLLADQILVRVKFTSFAGSSFDSNNPGQKKFDYIQEFIGKVHFVGSEATCSIGQWVGGIVYYPRNVTDYLVVQSGFYRVLPDRIEPRVDHLLTLSTAMVVNCGLGIWNMDLVRTALIVGPETEFGLYTLQVLRLRTNIERLAIVRPERNQDCQEICRVLGLAALESIGDVYTRDELDRQHRLRFNLVVQTIAFDQSVLRKVTKGHGEGAYVQLGMKVCGHRSTEEDAGKYLNSSVIFRSFGWNKFDENFENVSSGRIKHSYFVHSGFGSMVYGYRAWADGASRKPVFELDW